MRPKTVDNPHRCPTALSSEKSTEQLKKSLSVYSKIREIRPAYSINRRLSHKARKVTENIFKGSYTESYRQ